MNCIPQFCRIIAIIFLVATKSSWGQSSVDPIARMPPRLLPIKPGELLKLLPPTPTEWKVTTSIATNQITEWLNTIAIRSIEYTLPAEPGKSLDSVKVLKTSFRLIDSGFDTGCIAQFDNFKSGKEGPIERMLIHGCPTVISDSSDSRQVIDILLQRRFVLHLEVNNQGKDTWRAWVERLPYDGFASVPTTGDQTLPNGIRVVTVDELHPENNRETIQFVREDSQ